MQNKFGPNSLNKTVLILVVFVLGFVGITQGIKYINSETTIPPSDEIALNRELLNTKKDGDTITLTLTKSPDILLKLEVANSDESRTTGLMNRLAVKESEGMLFIFDDLRQRVFWMKDTLIPLDIIFLDENFAVVNFYQNTKPNQTGETYPSKKPCRYVIETKGLWSKNVNLNISDTFQINDSK
jgi:uncharacterized membrane protein (UPF0127 family)